MNTKLQNKGWHGMKTLLDQTMPTSRRRPLFIWWSAAGVALLLVSGVAFYFVKNINSLEGPVSLSDLPGETVIQANSLGLAGISGSEMSEGQKVSSIQDPEIVSKTSLESLPEKTLTADISDHSQSIFEDDKFSMHQGRAKIDEPKDFEEVIHEEIDAQDGISDIANISVQTEIEDEIVNDDNDIYLTETENADITEEGVTFSAHSSVKWRKVVSAGVGSNIVEPVNLVGQIAGGVDYKLSSNWSLQALIGGGFNQFNFESGALLKERNMRLNQELDSANPNEGFQIGNANNDYDQALISISRNYFLFNEIGLTYTSRKGMRIRTGVESAYRLGIESDYIRQLPYTSQGHNTMSVFRGREIESIYKLYNRWDFRPFLGIGWTINDKWSVDLNYRHGLNSLIAHPMDNVNGIYNRNIQLECRYAF
jgi:hypothetical protein